MSRVGHVVRRQLRLRDEARHCGQPLLLRRLLSHHLLLNFFRKQLRIVLQLVGWNWLVGIGWLVSWLDWSLPLPLRKQPRLCAAWGSWLVGRSVASCNAQSLALSCAGKGRAPERGASPPHTRNNPHTQLTAYAQLTVDANCLVCTRKSRRWCLNSWKSFSSNMPATHAATCANMRKFARTAATCTNVI